MKKSFLVLVMLSLSLCVYSFGLAQVTEDTLTAKTEMPTATGFLLSVSKVASNGETDPALHTWSANPAPQTTLDMGPLTRLSGTASVEYPVGSGTMVDRTWVVFLPEFYFAVDVGINGGLNPDKDFVVNLVADSETIDGVATSNGLGPRGNVAYVRTELTDWLANTTVDTLRQKRRYNETVTITAADIEGGWLRMYVGTANGNPTPPGDAAGSKLFTPDSLKGLYEAQLQITYG